MSWMNWVHNTPNWAKSYDLCIARPASEHWCPPSQEHRHVSLSSGIHLWTRTDTLLEEPFLPASSLSRETQTHLYLPNQNLTPSWESITVPSTAHPPTTSSHIELWPLLLCGRAQFHCTFSLTAEAPASTWRNISREVRLSITSNATVVIVRKNPVTAMHTVVSCPVASLLRSDRSRVQPSHHCWFWTYPALLHAQKYLLH